MKFYCKDDKLIIEEDYWVKRINPYSPNEELGKYTSFIGVIKKYKWGEEMGLARVIDRSYKGKDDDYTDIVFYFDGTREEFEKMCKKAGLSIVEIYKGL